MCVKKGLKMEKLNPSKIRRRKRKAGGVLELVFIYTNFDVILGVGFKDIKVNRLS